MFLWWQAPIAAAISLVFGTMVGRHALGLREKMSNPIPLRDRDILAILTDFFWIYFAATVVTTLGLASIFLPSLPKDTPRVLIPGMAIMMVGVIRVLTVVDGKKELCNPLMMGIAAGSSIGIFLLFTATDVFQSMIGPITQETPWVFLLTMVSVTTVTEVLVHRIPRQAIQDMSTQAGGLGPQTHSVRTETAPADSSERIDRPSRGRSKGGRRSPAGSPQKPGIPT